MRHFRSLREYVEALREIDEIQEIEVEVDWNLELGAIIQRSYEIGAPAPLFNRIRGIEAGFPGAGSPAGVSRTAGWRESPCRWVGPQQPVDANSWKAWQAAHGRPPPIPPRHVADGPCKQHKFLARRSICRRLPAPLIHAGDGGRYVNTWGTVIVQTPDAEMDQLVDRPDHARRSQHAHRAGVATAAFGNDLRPVEEARPADAVRPGHRHRAGDSLHCRHALGRQHQRSRFHRGILRPTAGSRRL